MSFDDLPRDIRYIVLDYVESFKDIWDNRNLWQDYYENNKIKRVYCDGLTIRLFEGWKRRSIVSIESMKLGNNDYYEFVIDSSPDYLCYVFFKLSIDVDFENWVIEDCGHFFYGASLYEVFKKYSLREEISKEPLVIEKLVKMINRFIEVSREQF